MILSHVYQKLHSYNPEQPIGNWTSTVCINRFKNILRDFFYKSAPPCLGCASYENDGLCRIYGNCSSACPLYADWQKSKKANHDVSLPLPISNHENETHNTQYDTFDLPEKLKEVTEELRKVLSDGEFLVFESLFLECRNETETAAHLGYKSDKLRGSGNRQIQNIR